RGVPEDGVRARVRGRRPHRVGRLRRPRRDPLRCGRAPKDRDADGGESPRLAVEVSTPLSARPDRLSFSIFDLVHYPYETEPAAFDAARAKRVYDDHLREWTESKRMGCDTGFLTAHNFT